MRHTIADPRAKVAVIISAYDEAERIGAVLAPALKAKLVQEVIVVNDGSKDKTAEAARKFEAVKVVDLPRNRGKGGAMCAGVVATDAKVLCFLDADLIGLKPEHIDQIIRPVLGGVCEMCVGIFRGGKLLSDASLNVMPSISGQRAMPRTLFESVPGLGSSGMGVEVSITRYVKKHKIKVSRVVLRGVSNTYKESKRGLVEGTKARMKMYKQMARAAVQIKVKRVRLGLTSRKRTNIQTTKTKND